MNMACAQHTLRLEDQKLDTDHHGRWKCDRSAAQEILDETRSSSEVQKNCQEQSLPAFTGMTGRRLHHWLK